MSPDFIQTPFQSAGDPRTVYATWFREAAGWDKSWKACSPSITATDDADAIKHLQATVDSHGVEGMEYCLTRQNSAVVPNLLGDGKSMPMDYVPASICRRTVPQWRWRIERKYTAKADWCDLSDEDLPGMLTDEFTAGEHEALRRLRAARLSRDGTEFRLVRKPLDPDFEPFEEPPPEPWAKR